MPNESEVVMQAGEASITLHRGDAPGLCRLTGPGLRVWADAAYQGSLEISLGNAPVAFDRIKSVGVCDASVQTRRLDDGTERAELVGTMAGCRVTVAYDLAADGGALEERVRVTNEHGQAIRVVDWDFGIAKQLTGGTWGAGLEDVAAWRAAAVPWRRPLHDPDHIAEYDMRTLLERRGGMNPFATKEPVVPWTAGLPSEAWALMDGEHGLLVLKHNENLIEYSVLRHVDRAVPPQAPDGYDQVSRVERGPHLLFGGSTRAHEDPTPDLLEPGDTLELGLTRYEFFRGDWPVAFERFKQNMNRWGKRFPADYDPPVHWNQLYSSGHQWWLSGPELEASKQAHYGIDNLRAAAATAVAYHCQTLYLDPGWDTSFGSLLWDEARLGPFADFCAMIDRDFGLKVGLHAPGAAWCDPQSYPGSATRLTRDGNRPGVLCGGSHAYLETRAQRLRQLARDGAAFFLLDGSFFTGDCHDPSHGHPVPYTRDAHMAGNVWLARQVHEANAATTVQLHDMQTVIPYCPVYLGYGDGGWDEMWAWEMWHSVLDYLGVRNHKGLGLYYYNLAYEIPLYLHMDLRGDNLHAYGFWWFATTVRHLGFGGATQDPVQARVSQQAVAHYRKLKPWFVRGHFIGLHEGAILRTLDAAPGGVLMLFNHQDQAQTITCQVNAGQLGLEPGTRLAEDQATLAWNGPTLSVERKLPARAAAVLELFARPDAVPDHTT